MSHRGRLSRFLATRSGRDIELALVSESGETLRVLASPDQIDQLVDELEDILNSPDEPDEPPEAA